MAPSKTISILLLFISLQNYTQAQEVFDSSPELDLPLLIGSSTLFAAGYAVQSNIPALEEADIAGLSPDDVNPLDRNAIGYYIQSNALYSDVAVGAMMVAPLSVFFYEQARKEFWPIVIIGAETAAFINGLVSLSKGTFRRVRPFVYDEQVPLENKTTAYAREAFFSGHTSNAATFGFLSAYMIDQYTDNKAVEIIAWTVGTSVPLLTGIFRFRSGNHFPTDIIAGYLIGGGTGILIPWLHRVQNSDRTRNGWPKNLVVMPSGFGARAVLYF